MGVCANEVTLGGHPEWLQDGGLVATGTTHVIRGVGSGLGTESPRANERSNPARPCNGTSCNTLNGRGWRASGW